MIKLPEPFAYEVHRAMCEPDLSYVKQKGVLSNEPLYTESQMRQAIKDALEEAADLCETFDATHPKYLADAIRKLKENV